MFQLTPDVLHVMSDEQLKQLGLTSMGDRLAVKVYCAQVMVPSDCVSSRRAELLLRLKSKARSDREKASHLVGNSHALRSTRKCTVGWFHRDSVTDAYQQVRARRGGGVRCVEADMNGSLDFVLKEAKDAFFPDGNSHMGHVSSFRFDLWDFKRDEVDLQMNVREYISKTKVCKLRWYMVTNLAENDHATVDMQDASQVSSDVSIHNLFFTSLLLAHVTLPYFYVTLHYFQRSQTVCLFFRLKPMFHTVTVSRIWSMLMTMVSWKNGS